MISSAGHIRASIDLVEAAIARTTADSDQHAANVIAPDDVALRHLNTSCALNARNASLGSALQFLLDAAMSEHRAIRLTLH